MRLVVGHSDDPDSVEATDDVVSQVLAKLDGERPVGALLYTCMEVDHQRILDLIQAKWPGLPLIGSTTDGECSNVLEFMEDSVVLTLITGDELNLRVGLGTGLRTDPDQAARQAVEQVCADGPPGLVVAFPESLGVSGAVVVDSLNRYLPAGSTLIGGTAADQWQFVRPLQFFGNQILTGAVPVMAFGANVKTSVGVASGWRPMGPRGVVTRSDGPILYELDHKPAGDFFFGYMGSRAEANPEFPFAIYEPGREDFYLRAPFGVDSDTGAITFAGDIPQGAEVRVSEAGRDQILVGAQTAVERALDGYPGDDPAAMMVFSCAARKQVLGMRCGEEIGLIQAALDVPLEIGGFYTYGEIAPLQSESRAVFHNETVVAALVGG